jgi:hypothetical protein
MSINGPEWVGIEKSMDAHDDERIYVAIAETVQVPYSLGLFTRVDRSQVRQTIIQVPGRMAAQACHAVSQLRLHMFYKMFVKSPIDQSQITYSLKGVNTYSWHDCAFKINEGFRPITTVLLSVRDSHELVHVSELAHKKGELFTVNWYDTNPEVYGDPGKVFTALAAFGTQEDAESVFDYLPLWTPTAQYAKQLEGYVGNHLVHKLGWRITSY